MTTLAEQIRAMPVAKELVWTAKNDWHHIADNIFGECWIKHYSNDLDQWTLYGPGFYGSGNHFATLDLAKAAAQADHEARLTAATNDLRGMLADAIERLLTVKDYIYDTASGHLQYRGRADLTEMAKGDQSDIEATLARIAAQIGGAK